MEHDWVLRGKKVLDIEIEGLQQVRQHLGSSFVEAVHCIGACTGRVIVTGIGKSGLVGRKLAATFSSTGTPAFFLHPVEGAHGDLGIIQKGDIVIAISYSGKSEELNAILPAIRSLGTLLIAFTSGLSSPLAHLADVVVDTSVPREACPMNLAPTASTTATLALGDALAVCLMELKDFTVTDFKKNHPAGALGQRLALRVGDIMHADNLPLIYEDSPLNEGVAVLDSGGIGALAVLNKDKILVGILTDGDIRRTLSQGVYDPKREVKDFMTQNPLHCTQENSAAQVMDMMEQKMITVLPVVDTQNHLVGMVHLHDLLGKGSVKFSQ